MLGSKSNKNLIVILAVTVFAGFGAFMLGRSIDSSVASINEVRYQIEEKTRFAIDQESRIEELRSVEAYIGFFEENLAGSEDVILMLEQLEYISRTVNLDFVIKLEEGTIGEGEIEFLDSTSKQKFLSSLEVKEYETESSSQPQQQVGGGCFAASCSPANL